MKKNREKWDNLIPLYQIKVDEGLRKVMEDSNIIEEHKSEEEESSDSSSSLTPVDTDSNKDSEEAGYQDDNHDAIKDKENEITLDDALREFETKRQSSSNKKSEFSKDESCDNFFDI
jgi:hypothetical protein